MVGSFAATLARGSTRPAPKLTESAAHASGGASPSRGSIVCAARIELPMPLPWALGIPSIIGLPSTFASRSTPRSHGTGLLLQLHPERVDRHQARARRGLRLDARERLAVQLLGGRAVIARSARIAGFGA